MNTVELRNPQQPEPQPQPGDVYRYPEGGLYILQQHDSGAYSASSLVNGRVRNGYRDTIAAATAGLAYIGPCRITVEPLKGEGKL